MAAPPMNPPNVVELCQPQVVKDSYGVDRLALSEVGWEQWTWRDHKVNFVQAGDSGDPVLLIHGFGASSYHWRYNIFELAKTNRVFAIDLLGFGFSEKLAADYGGAWLWSEQIRDFLNEVVGGDSKVVLAGNSLGGYVSLATAARNPDLVKGVIALNSAGYFENPADRVEVKSASPEWWNNLVSNIQEQIKKVVILFSFYSTKLKVKDILKQVYAAQEHVDDDLERSILLPSEDPNAFDAFYTTVSGSVTDNRVSLDVILGDLKVPMLLLWGEKDPWILPSKADKMMGLYKNSKYVGLDAGHCPQDEVPDQVNDEIKKWMGNL